MTSHWTRALIAILGSGLALPALAETIVITAPSADVMSGSTVVGQVARGQRFEVLEAQGSWFKIRIAAQSEGRLGWVHRQHATLESAAAQRPLSARQRQLLSDRLTSLASQALALAEKRRPQEMIPLGREILQISIQLHGPESRDTAYCHFELGRSLRAATQYAEAKESLETALSIFRKVAGDQDLDTADAFSALGLVLEDLGDSRGALKHFEQAMSVFRARHGEDHFKTAAAYSDMGTACLALARYDEAKGHFQAALDIHLKIHGEKHDDTAAAYNNLAIERQRSGDYQTARQYAEKAVAIRRDVLGDDHPDTISSYNNLAVLQEYMGEHLAARHYHQLVLNARIKTLGENHLSTATSYNNLGIVLQQLGDYAGARALHEKALAIRRTQLGDEHGGALYSYVNLAHALRDLKDVAGARHNYQRAVELSRLAYGEEHPNTAMAYDNLAVFLSQQGDEAAARPNYQRALDIRIKVFGARHLETAASYNNLGWTLLEEGDFAGARQQFEAALEIDLESLGERHRDTVRVLTNLGLAATHQKDLVQAEHFFDRAMRGTRYQSARVLPGLTQVEQARFLADHADAGYRLTFAWQYRDRPSIVERSASWVINGKGVAQEALAQRVRLTREDQRPEVKALEQSLSVVRNRLAVRSMSASGAKTESVRQRESSDLEAREKSLTQQLGLLGLDVELPKPWVELDEVRQTLNADCVLVEMARFDVQDLRADNKVLGTRYLAWPIPPQQNGPVRMVDLGPADAIERCVQQARQELQTAGEHILDEGEAAAENRSRRALRALAKLVLDPLAPHLEQAQKVILSPDGALWLVPWSALPLEDGSYFIEKCVLNLVVTGRDLAARPGAAPPATQSPLVLADPDYDLTPPRTADRSKPASDGLFRSSQNGLTSIAHVARLPGTALEAQAILPSLQKLGGGEPLVYTAARASETVFKAARHPRVISVATHGFFLQQPEANKLAANPLLRCGLLLAGCNRRQLAAESQDDGVLTGLEIVGVDLRGTELAVLSACDTGLGDVQNGEGVAGLRQAFQLAGAEAVLATLWQVSDEHTARLMTQFFANLADGKSKADALRSAQLAMIHQRRATAGAAHPLFWAPFTLTGQRK